VSREAMKRDFERLARERVAVVVGDVLDLYETAGLDRRDAAVAVLGALFGNATRVMATAEPIPDRDELYLLIDSLLRSAARKAEQVSKAR
jgi:hypothetical protein